jgi:hypothetical protein
MLRSFDDPSVGFHRLTAGAVCAILHRKQKNRSNKGALAVRCLSYFKTPVKINTPTNTAPQKMILSARRQAISQRKS